MDVHDGPGGEQGADHLQDSGSDSSAPPGAGGSAGGGADAPGTMTVDLGGGDSRRLPAEKDYTGDGQPDAVTETPDGRVIVFADTGDNETGAPAPDGRADEAYVVDKRTGRVVGAAHVEPASGSWVEIPDQPEAEPGPGEGPESGAGAVDAGAGGTPAGAGTAGGPGAADPGRTGPGAAEPPSADPGDGAGGTIAVELGGETRRLAAERDYTGDGRPDAATETPDGRVIVFADTGDNDTGAPAPDGRADEAYVVDKRTGRVIGAAHVDPRTGAWVDDAGAADPPPAGSSAAGEVDG